MADLIYREAARNALYNADALTMRGVAILNGLPAVDAVEVVRCKDCKHSKVSKDLALCYHPEYDLCEGVVCHKPDFYCGYGERRADNG